MNTMAATTRITFDTLNFVKRLEAAGVPARVAEVQAELQLELQTQVLDKFTEYEPLLDEIKITKGEFATKSDILSLKSDISKLESEIVRLDNKIDNLQTKLTLKLGSAIAASTAVITALITIYR